MRAFLLSDRKPAQADRVRRNRQTCATVEAELGESGLDTSNMGDGDVAIFAEWLRILCAGPHPLHLVA